MESLGPELLKLVQIIWINIILSGDNAVVIAMACRGLPPDKQRPGMMLGALVAVVLRIIFTRRRRHASLDALPEDRRRVPALVDLRQAGAWRG